MSSFVFLVLRGTTFIAGTSFQHCMRGRKRGKAGGVKFASSVCAKKQICPKTFLPDCIYLPHHIIRSPSSQKVLLKTQKILTLLKLPHKKIVW